MDKSNNSEMESIRAMRISMLLVDTCTEILREIISLELKRLNLSLADYLDKHSDAIRADQKFLFFDIDTLFKHKNPIKKFDICLCNKLLVRLLTKNHVAIKHISLLKKIRNENYGHLYKFGLDKKTFALIYKQIKDCILELTKIFNLPSRESEVNSLENRSFNESEINRYKDQLMNLMYKDHEHLATIFAAIKDGDKKQNKIFTELCSGRIKTGGQLKDLRSKLHNLFKIVTKNDYETLLEQQKIQNETMKQVFESVETIKNNHIVQTTAARNHQLQTTEQLDGLATGQAAIIEIIKEKYVNLENMVNCKSINLTDFQAYFDETSSEFNFRILVIDVDTSVYENQLKDKDDFFKAIAFASWNLIVDLNPHARMISELKAQLVTKKNYVIVDFDTVKNQNLVRQVEAEVSRTIKNGSYKCYLAVDLTGDNEYFEGLQEFNLNFADFLGHVTDRDNAIMCTNLIVKPTGKHSYFENIEEINKSTRGVVFKQNPKESLQLIHLVLSDLQQGITPEIRKVFESKINKIDRKCCITTLDQFLCANKGNFLVQNAADFTLPAAKGTETNWSRKDNTTYSAFFKVLYCPFFPY